MAAPRFPKRNHAAAKRWYGSEEPPDRTAREDFGSMRRKLPFDLSPQCTFCIHWEPGMGRRCAIFDQIPGRIWAGKQDHFAPIGEESGTFAPHPEVERTPESAAILDAYDEWLASQEAAQEHGHGQPER